MKIIISALVGLIGMVVMAVTPGQWNANFAESLAYAETNHIPIVVVWGNTSCAHCHVLKAVLEGEAVRNWVEAHPSLLVLKHEPLGSESTDNLASKEWIRSLKKVNEYPFVGVYWKDTNGTVVCSTAFVGRKGKMPATTPDDDLAGQFVNSLDQLIGGYCPLPDGGPYKEIVDGIEWTFMIENGEAAVGNSWCSAISIETSGAIMIPQMLGGCVVRRISDYAFCDCGALTGVEIPSSVTDVGCQAFQCCYGLSNMTMPLSVTSIGDGAFADCTALTDVTISEGVEFIGDYAFGGCYALKSVTIPACVKKLSETFPDSFETITDVVICEGVETIGYGMFDGCVALTRVVIPPSVTVIEAGAFSDCTELKNVTIPACVGSLRNAFYSACQSITNVVILEGTKSIVSEAFSGCAALASVTIPSSVKIIGENAFSRCYNLTSIIIPEGVTSVGDGAFSKCASMTNVVFEGDMPDFGYGVFEGTPRKMTIEVSEDAVGWDFYEKYKQIPAWGDRTIVVADPSVVGGEGQGARVSNLKLVSLIVTNVVVHYIQTSELSPMAAPITKDTGIVNVLMEVRGGNVSVPDSWATNYPAFKATFGSEFSDALVAETGKFDAGGNPMRVWQDYVAGTDPTDKDDVFKASVTMVGGVPVISYTPTLSDAEAAKRKYTTWGKVKLQDEQWVEIPADREADYNFFKVTVEMK